MDFNTLKTLYEEILQTQAVSEKQLQELRELIDSLNSLRSDYANVDNNLTKNAKLLTTILQKANILYKNLTSLEAQTNKNLQRLQQELKSTKDNLDDLMATYKDFSKKAKEFWSEQTKLAKKELNYLKKQIETQTQEIFTELEQKSLLQKWGAVAGAFAIGVFVSFVFLIPTIKAKMHADKIVQVVKIKDPQAQEIIANLNNKIANLEQ